jgi:hypothetical protein
VAQAPALHGEWDTVRAERTPRWHCTECGRALADAATVRRRRGLPLRSPYSATCSDRCERTREARFRQLSGTVVKLSTGSDQAQCSLKARCDVAGYYAQLRLAR